MRFFRKKIKNKSQAQEDIIADEIKKGVNKELDIQIEEKLEARARKTVNGVRKMHLAWLFVGMGFISEIVDAIFLKNGLQNLLEDDIDFNETQAWVVSGIIALGCFASMAIVGYFQGNRKYYSKKGERTGVILWFIAGVMIAAVRVMVALKGLEEDPNIFIGNIFMALLQFTLYLATGSITRDSVKILTDNPSQEYQVAVRDYNRTLKKLSKKRGEIVADISTLKAYQKYADRLIKTKKSVSRNVAQYNKAARALVEAKMAISVSPDRMEGMYDAAMEKERNIKD